MDQAKVKFLSVISLKALAALLSFYVGVVVANELDFLSSTKYFYALNISMMFGSLATLGLSKYILQIHGNDNNHSKDIVKKLSVVLLLAFLSLLIFSPALLFYTEGVGNFLLMLLLSLGFMVQSLSVAYLYSMKKQFLGIMVETVIPYGIVVLGIKLQILETFFSVAVTLAGIIIFLSLISLLKGKQKYGMFLFVEIQDIFSLIKQKDFISYLTLMFLAVFVSYFPAQVGSFFITTEEVTFILVSIKISSVLRVFYTALVSLYAPKIAQYHREKRYKSLEDTVLSSTLVLMLFGALGSISIYLFSDIIVDLYGEKYSGVSRYLPWVLIFQFAFISTGVVGYALMMTEKAHILKKSLILNLVLLAPIAIALSYWMKDIGVAIGYGVLLAGQHVFASVALHRSSNINILKFYKQFGKVKF